MPFPSSIVALDGMTGIAGADDARGQIAGDHRTDGDNSFRTNRHTRGHKNLGSDPGSVLDCDRTIAIRHFRLPEVMVPGANKRALRNAAVCSNHDWFKVEEKHLFPDPGMVANLQLPRKMDVHARLDIDLPADPGAEKPQQRAFERSGPRQRRQEKEAFQQIPRRLNQPGAAAAQSWRASNRSLRIRVMRSAMGGTSCLELHYNGWQGVVGLDRELAFGMFRIGRHVYYIQGVRSYGSHDVCVVFGVAD